MSYTPTTWNSGDVVTSAKLNNIESGISNAVQFVDVIVDNVTYMMTAAETAADIWAKVQAGIVVFLFKLNGTVFGVSLCTNADTMTIAGGYIFGAVQSNSVVLLEAASGTDYPAATNH